MPRFYIAPENWTPENLTLSKDESHHALTVLRMSEGDKVVAFDGRGAEISTTIASVADKHAVALAAAPVQKSAPLRARIALAQAVPKGKNMDLIIEKATELGAAEIHPLLSERTVIKLDAAERAKKQDKWQRVAVGACKQSGQNYLPTVSLPQTPDQFFASPPQYDLLLVASLQPGSKHLKEILREARGETGKAPGSVLILVGPEGDYTPAEINLAQNAGCRPMTLGPIVLRTETAAIYSLSVLAYELLDEA